MYFERQIGLIDIEIKQINYKLKGAPKNHEIPIREVRLSSGANFIVVVCGSIMTMPGLPKVPAADNIKLNKNGETEGLF